MSVTDFEKWLEGAEEQTKKMMLKNPDCDSLKGEYFMIEFVLEKYREYIL